MLLRELWCLSQLNQERNAIMNGSTRVTRDDVLDLCEAIHATNPDLPVFGARGLGARGSAKSGQVVGWVMSLMARFGCRDKDLVAEAIQALGP